MLSLERIVDLYGLLFNLGVKYNVTGGLDLSKKAEHPRETSTLQ